jgi:hypothetical protein
MKRKRRRNIGRKAQHVLTYLLLEVADASCWRLKDLAGGDARSAVFAGWTHVMRHICHLPAGSVVAELLFVFDPQGDGRDRQSRLRLYLRFRTSDATVAKAMSVLVERGPLTGFCKFQKVTETPCLPQGSSARCEIVRCHDVIPALHSGDFNPHVPEAYHVIRPFVPNKNNDWLVLDKVLDRVDEPMTIGFRIEPADTRSETRAVTSLMDNYYGVNHGRDFEREDDFGIGIANADGFSRLPHFDTVRPLNLRDPSADDAWHAWRPIHQALCHEPHLLFSITVRAQTEAVAQLIGGEVAESGFGNGSYCLQVGIDGRGRHAYAGRRDTNGAPTVPSVGEDPGEQSGADLDRLARLTHLATVDELAGVFRTPVAGAISATLCVRRNTDPPYEDPQTLIVCGYDDQGIEGNPHPLLRGLFPSDLLKHLFNCGASGSGKTTTNTHLLLQLDERGIPFIVIETSKRELRIIKALKNHNVERVRKLARKLQVFTVGNEKCSPLRFSPVEVAAGIDPLLHIEKCSENLLAAMPIFPALPGILGEALERMYEGKTDPGTLPDMHELHRIFLAVLSEKAYCGEANANLRAASDVRIGGLTRRVAGSVFKCRRSVPSVAQLMSSHSVVELDLLTRSQKCLMTLCLLTSIWEHLSLMPAAEGLRLVILIEECHNIFSPSGPAKPSEEAADPGAFVVDLIKRLLVELRALGVGVILSDQHPTNLDRAAIKCTGAKIIGKQPDGQDHEMLRQSVGLSQVQTEDLARLRPGEVYFFKEGYYRPLRIRTANLHEELNLPRVPTDDELFSLIKDEEWFTAMAQMRTELELNQLKHAMDRFDRNRGKVVGQVVRLLKAYDFLLGGEDSPLVRERLRRMMGQLGALRKSVVSAYKDFKGGPYRLFAYLIEEPARVGYGFETLADSLGRRFHTVIKTQSRDLLKVIDRLINNCSRQIVKETHYGTTHAKTYA